MRGLLWGIAILSSAAVAATVHGADPATAELLFQDDFEHGTEHWEPTDPRAWTIGEAAGNHFYRLKGASKYAPPHRSPLNFSLYREFPVGDFTLEARVRSTKRDYDHRDMCIVFGYQSPSRFYYVHFGKKTDDHANQIFIVDDAPRTKISTITSPGTNWDDEWHRVKVVRTVADGHIDVYFDDMQQPVMRAIDKRFLWGQIGLGSFDDIGDWDDVRVTGTRARREE